MNKYSKKTGFITPAGYFDGLKDKIMDKVGEEVPKLPHSEGFNVPDHYFDTLEKRIQSKIYPVHPRVFELRAYKNFYYVAASVAALVLGIYVFNGTLSYEELTFDDLANFEIYNYLNADELDLTTYDLAEVLPVEELEFNQFLEDPFEEQNIIDYLNERIEDFEALNLDLDE